MCNWLYSIPATGAGKSVLSAYMVEETRNLGNFQVLYFFFRNGCLKTSMPLEMVASLT
ncbi:hypothetical protein BDD12DRAFT_815972, partial [Trichophaea hybrida]